MPTTTSSASEPADQPNSVSWVMFCPPLTEEAKPLAVLPTPPLTTDAAPLAVWLPPPLTDALNRLCQLSRHEGEADDVAWSNLVYAAAIMPINWANRS